MEHLQDKLHTHLQKPFSSLHVKTRDELKFCPSQKGTELVPADFKLDST